jgi:HEAT repeat protein
MNRSTHLPMIPKTKPLWRLLPVWCVLLLTLQAAPLSAEPAPGFLMAGDPEFRALPPVKDFKRDFKGIWLLALQRPEADYQRMAAETVARAHQHGIPDLAELAPTLEKILSEPASHPAARYAAARALIVLESRESAPGLLEAGLKYGADLRQLIEPALAQWDFGPARAVWTKRLESAATFPRDLILALRGLGRVRDATALPTISRIAVDPLRPAHIRLEAAQAAGEMGDSGLESEAEQLAHDRRASQLVNRLCAVRLLVRHSSKDAQNLLVELAGESEPAVVAAALQRLNDIDPELVVPLAEQALQNADPRVREAGATAWIRRPSPERIKTVTRLLDDDHPSLRKLAGESLCQLAENPELGEVIRAGAMQVLAGNRWQGQVQAMLVLAMLEYKPAADRFSELLESTRPDVMTHAAWGLRKLAEPRTIPAIVEKIRRQTIARKTATIPGVDEQVAHLFEACGTMQAREAEPLMMQYVPRDSTRTMDNSRGAAIWALGRLHAGTLDGPLADALIARVRDESLKPPESPLVKQMAVVALVRINAADYGPAVKKSIALHTPASALDLATRWAVRELTGEELPPPVPPRFPDGVWFLEPLEAPAMRQP